MDVAEALMREVFRLAEPELCGDSAAVANRLAEDE
jgi:hypothetical protein